MLERIRETVRSWFRPKLPALSMDALSPYVRSGVWHGEKFPGGLGPIDLLRTDYWALRERSGQLFKTNLYARGIIRRMVTNEINVGLHLEATPEEKILGYDEDELAEWSEDVENRFALWAKDPWLCDYNERLTWGQLQAVAKCEALVSGDVLVSVHQHQATGMPRVRLTSGACVQTPMGKVSIRDGNKICHGVEMDVRGRHVAYWVRQNDGTSVRMPTWGEKSGRRIAWMLYGTDKRLDDVRGEPVLSLVLQSLREIDKYRDSIQRKANVLSMLVMFVKKTMDKMGTRPMSGGAVRRGVEQALAGNGESRSFRSMEHMPGLVIDELAQGEEPVAFQHQGTYEKFGEFERAIVQAFAWALEIPPEILMLSFGSNYSASQAAINEYKMALNRSRTDMGDMFCQPVYVEWLVSAVLTQKVAAPKLLEAWRDNEQYDVFAAWTSSDWAGAIKPAVDMTKLVTAYEKSCENGFTTRDRATRELTGTKFSKNVRKLMRENAQLADANRALVELENQAAAAPAQPDEPMNDKGEHPNDVVDDAEKEPNDVADR